MRRWKLLALPIFLILSMSLVAQPVLTVNGLPTGAEMTQGSVLSWSITVPPGTITNNQLWLDLNQNSRVDPATDRLAFIFPEQDGPVQLSDGPADQDGLVNGTITTSMNAGLAPAWWIFVTVATNGSDTAGFRITPMVSPVATIVGIVSTPVGVPRSNILVAAEVQGGPTSPFWHTLTDSNGNYTIAMGGTPASLNPWHVRVSESPYLGRLIPLRNDTTVSVGGTPPVVNFQLVLGTILTGVVKDNSNNPIMGANPHVHSAANYEAGSPYNAETGGDGRYLLTVPPGSWILHFNKDGYKDQWYNGKSSQQTADVIVTTTQDTIKNLDGVLIKAGLITGTVRNYGVGTNAQVTLMGMPGPYTITTRTTKDDGRYGFTVDPGTYFVKFDKDGNVKYWGNTTYGPGDSIVVVGTATLSGIDADFAVGVPPPPPSPKIARVWDVPFDNGRHVFVRFVGVEHLIKYSIDSDIPFGIEKYSVWRREANGWTYVGQVPAAMDSIYTVIVPTLRDSTKPDGMWWSRFMVKAHFLFNIYVVASPVDSGYSLDNLAPNVPGGASTLVVGNDVKVQWILGEEEDLRYYTIYRGTTPDFSVAGLTPLTRTTGTSYTDPGAASGSFYYRVTATDFAGNEGLPTISLSSKGTTGVDVSEAVPTVFALGQNYPNPFNPSTTIVFDVPTTAVVRIDLYNTLGQRLMGLVEEQMSPGRHSVRCDGSGLTSGLYLIRMTAGEFSATRKISLIK